MRTLILVAALTATAPTPAQEHAANMLWCGSANTPSDRRITACTKLIETGGLVRMQQADALYSRGNAYVDTSQRDRAIADYGQAIRLMPDFANAYHDRGRAHEKAGRFDRAIRDYDSAIRLKPDFAFALNDKAWLLATAPDAALRDGEEAVRLAQRALRLVDYPALHGTLAAAYAEAGRFADAVRAQEAAIARLRARGQILSIPDYEVRLDLYRAQRPYRR